MEKQRCSTEAICHATSKVDGAISVKDVKGRLKELSSDNRRSIVKADKSSQSEINAVMGEMGEDVEVIVDGKVQGTAMLSKLGVDTCYDYAMRADGSKYGFALITDAHTYTVVPDGDPCANQAGYITESDYDRLLYIVAHEVGTCNSNEQFGVATALLNSLEQQWDGNTLTANIDGFYERNTKWGLMHDAELRSQYKPNVKPYVDLVLSGTRAFTEEIQTWCSLEGSGYTRCKFGTTIDAGGTCVTSGKSGYR